MNRNGHGQLVDYYIKTLSEPDAYPAERAAMKSKRMNKVLASLLTRPFYLPIQFELPAAGQVQPITELTAQLGFDIVITGVRCDVWQAGTPGTTAPSGRDVIVSFTDNNESQSLVRTGGNTTLYLKTDDFAGSTVDAGGGQLGTFQLPNPIYLRKDNRIQVDMFKTDTTGAIEYANIVFIGYRVYPKAAAESVLDARELALINRYIDNTETPVTRWMKVAVPLVASVGAQATNLVTPRLEYPVIVRGFRTTMRYSTIQLGVDGESSWMPSATPIWALAAENDLQVDDYLWCEKGFYLPSQTIISIPLITNGGCDQSSVDPTDNEFTIIYDTV